jgi:beta-lactamase superfamily II metal-dependent hydrolase
VSSAAGARGATRTRALATLAAVLVALVAAVAPGAPTRGLEIYWVDVEGGGATLVVTPARESILIDTGFPDDRDAMRIHRVATQAAGLERIDHVIVTHFHLDHFGGLPALSRLMPVGTLHERSLGSAPEREQAQPELLPYKALSVAARTVVKPGAELPLRQAADAAPVRLAILGASGQFVDGAAAANPHCKAAVAREPDPSDNRNSVVSLLTFGGFRFFDGGDLTWNAEADLVCPRDRTGGAVDVYQTDHHASDSSNNPVLLRTLRPTVAVVNNGPRKGGQRATLAALRSLDGLKAVYQVHRSLEAGDANTDSARIANEEEDCAAHFLKLSVEADARSYHVWVPSTGHRKTYDVRAR